MSTAVAKVHVRINERLEEYWNALCKGRSMPLESDVNVKDLAEIWDHCFLVNIHPDKFAYSYLGPQLIEAYGDDLTGKEIAQTLLEPHPASLYAKFQHVATRGRPEQDDNEFRNSNGIMVRYRACILPLGSRSHTGVGYLLGGMKWKAY